MPTEARNQAAAYVRTLQSDERDRLVAALPYSTIPCEIDLVDILARLIEFGWSCAADSES